MIRHAGLIARRDGGYWRGVLIDGSSGSGKSDLALRALEAGFHLVADDRVLLWASGGRLFGRAPDALAGMIEVRGIDVISASAVMFAEVALVMRCGCPERLAEPETAEMLGVVLPAVTLAPLEASAAAKLGHALARFDRGLNRRI